MDKNRILIRQGISHIADHNTQPILILNYPHHAYVKLFHFFNYTYAPLLKQTATPRGFRF